MQVLPVDLAALLERGHLRRRQRARKALQNAAALARKACFIRPSPLSRAEPSECPREYSPTPASAGSTASDCTIRFRAEVQWGGGWAGGQVGCSEWAGRAFGRTGSGRALGAAAGEAVGAGAVAGGGSTDDSRLANLRRMGHATVAWSAQAGPQWPQWSAWRPEAQTKAVRVCGYRGPSRHSMLARRGAARRGVARRGVV